MEHFNEWIKMKKPAIELAEQNRERNGIGFLRKDDDLKHLIENTKPVTAAILGGRMLVTADGYIFDRGCRDADRSESDEREPGEAESDDQMPPTHCAVCSKKKWCASFASDSKKNKFCNWHSEVVPKYKDAGFARMLLRWSKNVKRRGEPKKSPTTILKKEAAADDLISFEPNFK